VASSRDLTLIDQLVTEISGSWEPESPDTVTREYLALVTDKDLQSLLGRRVYLFPMAYETQDENHSENVYGYRVGVSVIERYEEADKAGSEAVKAWLDERLDFVETELIDALDYGQNGLLSFGSNRKVWTESIEIPQRYDVVLLAEKKLFRCDVMFMFREIQA